LHALHFRSFILKGADILVIITNDACNMQCSYCVNKYKKFHPPEKMNSKAKLKILNQVVDQFFPEVADHSPRCPLSYRG
jgi:MoaA/NifB/PqqE/SkfB family radical SAM enzyme